MNTSKVHGKRFLTQGGLLLRLKRFGFDSLTDRTLKDWREKGLLPAFDFSGKGRGKGKGRTTSGWQNCRQVIRQAIFVKQFLDQYRRAEAAYLPLWFLGFEVSLENIRRGLIEPLENEEQSIWEAARELAGEETRTNGIIEDLVGELVAREHQSEDYRKIARFSTPLESQEALLNLLINPTYDLRDTEFSYARQKLLTWNDQLPEIAEKLIPGKSAGDQVSSEANSLNMFFDYAPFIQQYLSLPALKAAVQCCSNEILLEAQADLQILQELIKISIKLGKALSQNMPGFLKDIPLMDCMPMFIWFGRLFIWCDIALRVYGFGEVVNHLRNQALQDIKNYFTPETLNSLLETMPKVAAELTEVFEQLEEGLKKLEAQEQKT